MGGCGAAALNVGTRLVGPTAQPGRLLTIDSPRSVPITPPDVRTSAEYTRGFISPHVIVDDEWQLASWGSEFLVFRDHVSRLVTKAAKVFDYQLEDWETHPLARV
jgi:hypothetical protein